MAVEILALIVLTGEEKHTLAVFDGGGLSVLLVYMQGAPTSASCAQVVVHCFYFRS